MEGAGGILGFLILALPEGEPSGAPIGTFQNAQDGSGAALSQTRCDAVSYYESIEYTCSD